MIPRLIFLALLVLVAIQTACVATGSSGSGAPGVGPPAGSAGRATAPVALPTAPGVSSPAPDVRSPVASVSPTQPDATTPVSAPAAVATSGVPSSSPRSSASPAVPPGATLPGQAAAPDPAAAPGQPTAGFDTAPHSLIVTNAAGRHVTFLEPDGSLVDRVDAGAAPWGIALAPPDRAYITTAEGVAVVDTRNRRRIALIPHRSAVGPITFGEYRPGGMGIAADPNGRWVYAGVYLSGGPSRLEVIDVDRGAVVESIPIGVRPFQVLAAPDGRSVYTIDHDSYSVTVVDTAGLTTRTHVVAPIGRGAYDKPHYAAIDSAGRLLLPVQGRALVRLDPATGATETLPLTANTHQHGITLSPDGRRAAIVGTGPAGGATAGPSLTILDTATWSERILPLARPHENVAFSPDGRTLFLTGGYLLAGGWDGLTVVDVETLATREVPVSDRPQDIAILP